MNLFHQEPRSGLSAQLRIVQSKIEIKETISIEFTKTQSNIVKPDFNYALTSGNIHMGSKGSIIGGDVGINSTASNSIYFLGALKSKVISMSAQERSSQVVDGAQDLKKKRNPWNSNLEEMTSSITLFPDYPTTSQRALQ